MNDNPDTNDEKDNEVETEDTEGHGYRWRDKPPVRDDVPEETEERAPKFRL